MDAWPRSRPGLTTVGGRYHADGGLLKASTIGGSSSGYYTSRDSGRPEDGGLPMRGWWLLAGRVVRFWALPVAGLPGCGVDPRTGEWGAVLG